MRDRPTGFIANGSFPHHPPYPPMTTPRPILAQRRHTCVSYYHWRYPKMEPDEWNCVVCRRRKK